MPAYGNAFGFETLTVANTVKQLTATKYNPLSDAADADIVLISADGTAGTNDVRYTLDGTDPVGGATGHPLRAGQNLVLYGTGNLRNFKAIRDGSSNGTLQVTYFRA